MRLSKLSTLRKLLLGVAVVYTAVIAVILAMNIFFVNESALSLTLQTAETEFRKDMDYREWMERNGGVYARISAEVHPNPHIQHPERDVTTPGGTALTLLNPSYFSEQIYASSQYSSAHQARMVSLDPARNVQIPDAWERTALLAFEQGADRRYEVIEESGQRKLRYIRPVYGVPVPMENDLQSNRRTIRGALSYTIPLAEAEEHQRGDMLADMLTLIGIWVVGLAGLYLFGRLLRSEIQRRIQDQERFQQVTELSTDIIYIVDREMNIVRANGAFYRHLERDDVERAPIRLPDFVANRSDEELAGLMPSMFDGPQSFETLHLTLQGTTVPVEIAVIPVTINNGRFLYCTGRDISERKEREEKVKRSEQLFRQIWEQSAEGMRLTNADGIITKVNDAYCRMVERTREELEGKTLDVIFAPDRRADVLEKHRLNFAQHQLNNNVEKRVDLWNGEQRWFFVSNSYVLTEGHHLQLLGTFRDITERRRIEEQIRLSDAQLKLVTDHTQDLIYRFEFLPARRFTYVSPSSTHILGYTPEEHYTDPEIIRRSIHPEDRDKIGLWLRESTDGNITKEMRWLTKDGRTLWAEQKVTIEYDSEGRIAAIQGIARDITERKRIDEQLHLHAAALNAAANAIVITDLQGNIEWANAAFETITGYALTDAIGKNPRTLIKSGIHPAAFYKSMWETISAGRPWSGEVINRRKNGPMYVEEMTITPMLGPGGDVKHYIAIKQDVTDRKKIERQLIRDEQKFRSYMDASPLGIFVRDRNGRYEEINPAGVHMFGYSKEELLNETMLKLVDPTDEQRASSYYTNVQLNGYGTVELLCRRKDQSQFWVQVHAVRLPDGHIISYTEDITDRKNTQQQLLRQTKELETVVANLPGYIYRAVDDEQGGSTLLLVSDGVHPVTGYTADELKHKVRFIDRIHPEDLPMCWERTRQALLDHVPFELEYRITDKEGKERWLWERGRGIYTDDGQYLYSEGYVMDVTGRRRSERELFEATQQNKAIYEQSSVGMVVTDLRGRFLRANRQFCDMLGYQEEELRQRTFMEITHPEDLEGSLKQKQELLDGVQRSLQFEKRYRHRDGSYIWMRIDSVLIRDAAHAPSYFSSILQDITKEKNITNAVRSLAVHPSERSAESIFDVIVRNLVNALQADLAFIGIISEDGAAIRTLAMFRRGVGSMSDEFQLEGTPCREVLSNGMQYHASGIIERFPQDTVLAEMGLHSYLGIPLTSSTGRTIGILATLAEHPLEEVPNFREIQSLFAERTVSELERVETRQQLQQREEEFRFLVEHAQDVVVRLDTRGVVLYASPSVEQLGGYTSREAQGRSFKDFFASRQEAVSAFRELNLSVQNDENRRIEYRFRRKDGSTRWVEAIARPAWKEDGTVQLHAVLRDISDRKRANEVLQQYERIISATADSISLVDEQYRYLVVNDAYSRRMDRPKDQIEGHTIAEVFGETAFAESIRPNFDRCLAGEEVHYHAWFTFRQAGRRYMDVQYLPYRHGGVNGVLVSSRDITAAKEAEESAMRSEQRFKVVWESSNEAMRLTDEHGTIVMVNEAFCTLVRRSQEELVGKPMSVIYPPVPGVIEKYRKNFAERDVMEFFERPMSMADGRTIVVQSSNAFITIPGGETMLLSVFRDVTQRVEAEQQLKVNEQRYRSLVETMHQGMALHEMLFDDAGQPSDYRYVEVNKSFEEMTGLRRSDVVGKRVLEILPNTEAYWIEQFGAVVTTGEPRVLENYSQELDKFFEVVAYTPMPGHFVAIITDITERRRAEREVAAKEKQYRLLAENSTDVIWTMTFEGKFTYISPSVLQLRGFTPEEVMLQTLPEVVCPGSIDIVMDGLRRTIEHVQQGLPVRTEISEIEQPRKDGTTVWTEVVTHVMRNDEGTATGIIGVTRDITARKRSEDLLRARLSLSEYATIHTVKELLRRILDVAEEITESRIGFFHFVEDDQNTIALQTWSTNTLKNMCQAEGDGRHYSIDKAGVWVECIFTKKPVVHNDFALVEGKKGMPEGHAPVTRELLIPILRNDKVVAIMGVGNKLYDYDQRDVEIANQLATMSWDILERRRAELALQQHEQALAGLTSAAVELLHMTEKGSEAAIRSALAKVGSGLEADRVYIFQNTTDTNGDVHTSIIHEWVRPDIPREIDNPKNQNVWFREALPTMWETLSAGRTFAAYTQDLPGPERLMLSDQKIQSIILVPIITGEEFWGFFGIDSVRTQRRWSEDERALVHIAAESFGTAIQRMTAVAQLSEREEMLKFAMDASGDGIWTMTIPTRKLFFSDETKRMVGFDHTDVPDLFEFWLDHVHPADRQGAIEAMERHLTGQQPIFIHEHRFLCADGVYRWMLDRGKVLKWSKDGAPFQLFGTYSNIHHRKETEEEIRMLNERLEHKVQERTKQLHDSMQEMESFSYSISHDLRAPVRAIDSYAKILAEEEEEHLGPEGKRLLQNVRSNTARMGRMIDDLLQFSRASRAEIKKVPFDMQALVAKVTEEARGAEPNRVIRVATGFLPSAFGDPSLLRQVMVNLIGNAVKFSRHREEALIEIGGADADGMLTYWVKDNGTGFDMKYADKLFGVFQRLHNQQEFEGTGVGLAIVHRILQKHGGSIRVESAEGAGTTFTFTIPARPIDGAVTERTV